MKIVVIGAGAIGCLIAAFLSKIKRDVYLLDRNEARVHEIKNKGIRIEGISGRWKSEVRITTKTSEIGIADLIIICTKSYDTEGAIRKAVEIIGPQTLVLSLQNGLGNADIIAKYVNRDRVICGVTGMGSTVLAYGYIRHAGAGKTIIGAYSGGANESIHQISDLFIKAGISAEVTDDIKSIIWSKLMINACINPLTAIMRCKNGLLIEYKETTGLIKMILSEFLTVVREKKIDLLYNDPYEAIISTCRATSENLSSMLQDILNRRRTEIDYINGAIVREAHRLGVPVPVNEAILSIVKSLEKRQREHTPAP